MAIKVSVLSNKGGVGKTTLLANYVAELNAKQPNLKILFMDLDAQGNLSINFQGCLFNREITSIERYKDTIYDVLMGTCPIKEAIIPIKENLHILPANADMNYFSVDVLAQADKYKNPLALLKDKLAEIEMDYDYIFIDTPPSLELVTNMGLAATDQVMLPLEPDIFGIKGLVKMVEAVERCKKNVNRFLEIKAVVPMKYDSRVNVHSDMLALCRQYCQSKDIFMTFTCIKKSISYSDVVAKEGLPVVWTKKPNKKENKQSIICYTELYQELEEHLYST